MSQPAQQIAERYQLQLSLPWQAWFDGDWSQVPLVGSFRAALATGRLTVAAPMEIWPGFMLPDTLPLISNEYGEWICVRVEADGSLGELLHWYHGGGDWIPLGRHLAEMVVHDVVDQFRPVTRQMLRGAPESTQSRLPSQVLTDFCNPRLQSWLIDQLPVTAECSKLEASCSTAADSRDNINDTAARIEALIEILNRHDYYHGLECLRSWQWAADAVACDLIQFALQYPLDHLADSAIAQKLNMNWTPDYVRCLFDLSHVPQQLRQQMLSLAAGAPAVAGRAEETPQGGPVPGDWPQQNWQLAGQVAEEVLSRRKNLGWAVNIAGWNRQRQGDFQQAADIYFAGRLASSYSDQGVRMRSHWHDPHFGKFTLAQLSALRDYLTEQQQRDSYLQAVQQATAKSMTAAVNQFWMATAQEQMAANAPEEAYRSFYLAGWDLGVERLAEYRDILEGLGHAARAAGWDARAAVAETHLACLNRRLR